jgi:hypothetical protein
MNHYLLAGEIAAIKPSERVRLAGKPGRGKKREEIFLCEEAIPGLRLVQGW